MRKLLEAAADMILSMDRPLTDAERRAFERVLFELAEKRRRPAK